MAVTATALLDTTVLDQLRELQDPGEPDVVAEVVELVLSDTLLRLQQGRQAHAAGDLGALARMAHRVKGSAGLVGAERMASLAAKVEALAPAADIDELASLLGALERAFVQTRAALMGGQDAA
jgi:two-component system, sensor histidine kinase and response regulator